MGLEYLIEPFKYEFMIRSLITSIISGIMLPMLGSFTINRNMEGPDHKASMEPNELSLMVKSIRNIESALGDGIKKPTLSEIKNKNIARKSIVASKKIKEGEKFTKDNISLMRPGDGLSPTNWELVIGKNASRDFEAEEQIEI